MTPPSAQPLSRNASQRDASLPEASPSDVYDLDGQVTRGTAVESFHRVSAAVVRDDRLVGHARDSKLVTYWRSCAKPFQVLPMVEAGQIDQAGWGADEIAIAAGSHGGEPEHVALVQRMLRSMELEEGDLACGVQEPLSQRGLRLLRESGGPATRLHNNCSGKHAAMLARARLSGWATQGYERGDHPVQQSIMATVAHWSGLSKREIGYAVDGCGVVVFALPLEAMARAYSRFVRAAVQGDPAPKRVMDAMLAYPFLVSGTDRFDTVVMEETKGAVLCKVGAEGVHCAAVPSMGIGVAIKVEDGAVRAQYPALLTLLLQLGALPNPLPAKLAEFLHKPVRNSRLEVVGAVTPHARTPLGDSLANSPSDSLNESLGALSIVH